MVVALLAVVSTAGLSRAQSQACSDTTQELLAELEAASSPIEPMMEDHRRLLRSQGCDPQLTGYDIEATGIQLDEELDPPEESGPAFRVDQLIRLEY
ncbi:hypothetical protein EVJ50_11130 [Synechococcus sp. RSCCF101]|uniref:hypothetical protein n=1 Tax=Synechococcus sp. RSCCF101 TaxID=2511069 RepID=UPI001246D97C|nr:hypothetical protein [Synechococcus sp. RSCCF101]QEY32695.1 hypothetical protein EVJ50_11130 [Synechococcus sp. RSCCF101]